MANLKGTAWVAVREYLTNQYGDDAIARVRERLEPEDRILFSKPILPVTWFDYSAYMRFMIAADRLFGAGDLQIVREASIYNARRDLRGIYKMFISFTNPHFIIKNAGRVWRQYYDTGEIEVEWLKEKSGAFRLVKWPDIPLHHEVDQLPFIEETLRISGGRNPRVRHDKCMARGDAYCSAHLQWE